MPYAKQFQSGPRLIDGDELNEALAYPVEAYASGVTALIGGNVNNSPLITETFTQVDTVGAAAAGVALPPAVPGRSFSLANRGANSMQVFARGGSTINGTAGAVGLAQAAAAVNFYWCARAGQWNKQ